MNILFLTLSKIDDINQKGIYPDLMRAIIDNDHKVYIVSPIERSFGKRTFIIKSESYSILKVKTLNIQKTNIIEKGIGTLLLEHQFNKAINKFYEGIKFDLILYSTPPITLTNIVAKIKQRDCAKTYLLLKDIFPQNAVDIGILSKSSVLHKYFRKKETELYKISDYIGCMSPANVNYLIINNPKINPHKIEVCPNSIEVIKGALPFSKIKTREHYGIPNNSIAFIYGGNLGKPQGLDFLLKVLESNSGKDDRFFVIVGSGTEYERISLWFKLNKPSNAIIINFLPKEEYDSILKSCDVGFIFLDPRFTIPNYPSRLLSYLENKMPVLMATDINTDLGPIAQENGYGYWCENGDLKRFNSMLDQLVTNQKIIKQMGEKGYQFLLDNYQAKLTASIILSHF